MFRVQIFPIRTIVVDAIHQLLIVAVRVLIVIVDALLLHHQRAAERTVPRLARAGRRR